MITEVPRHIVYNAQKEYHPRFIWLREAKMDSTDREHPTCHGRFTVPDATYTKHPQKYIGCPEAIVCVNQLGYVAWAELIREGLVDCGMGLEEFLKLPPGGMSMVGIDKLKFKRPINKQDDFFGEVTLNHYRPGETTIAVAKFDFEDNSIWGTGMFRISKSSEKIDDKL